MDKRTLLIAASFLGVSLAMFFLMSTIIKNFLKTKMKIFIYVILTLVAFSLVALVAYPGLISSNPNILLAIFQGCFFGLGVLHIWALYVYLDLDKKDSLMPDLIYSLFIWLIGLVPFFLIYSVLSDLPSYQFYMLGASLFFIIPIFFRETFYTALSMPLPIMEQWFYPVDKGVSDPELYELQNPFVITFLMRKNPYDSEFISFRAKAPAEMNLGRLFYFFVEDYNEQHVEDTMEYTDEHGNNYGWVFYFEPKWYLLFTKRFVNPGETIRENKISEDTVVVCERADVLEEGLVAIEGEVS